MNPADLTMVLLGLFVMATGTARYLRDGLIRWRQDRAGTPRTEETA